MKPRLLIVDDSEEIRTQLRWGLGREYDILPAEDRLSAVLTFSEKHPKAVVLDLGLPPYPESPEEGMALLNILLANDPDAKVIVATGLSNRETTLRALDQGAYDVLSKPVEMEHLRAILRRAFRLTELEQKFSEMSRHFEEDARKELLGASSGMQEVISAIRRAANSTAPVLILGESGTGKTTAARAIHLASPRREGPFEVIDCEAVPEALIEGELFGNEESATAGVHAVRRGRIELSHGGTLLLDRVDHLPQAAQVRLRRFLQTNRIERLGGEQEIEVEVDARVIATSRSALSSAPLTTTFDEELHQILSSQVLNLPPLREREGDIHLMAHAFLKRFAFQNGKQMLTFHPEALDSLGQHQWPGNVRELMDRVKRAVIVSQGRQLTLADLNLNLEPAPASSTTTLRKARETVERQVVLEALERNNFTISRAAADLDISRPTLYELMNKLGIRKARDSVADD